MQPSVVLALHARTVVLTANLTMTTRLRNKSLKNMGQMECVGPSLGSFSVSKQLLELFLSGFKAELNAKVCNFDSHMHLLIDTS